MEIYVQYSERSVGDAHTFLQYSDEWSENDVTQIDHEGSKDGLFALDKHVLYPKNSTYRNQLYSMRDILERNSLQLPSHEFSTRRNDFVITISYTQNSCGTLGENSRHILCFWTNKQFEERSKLGLNSTRVFPRK
jgi:hypothetical protein